MNILFICTGNTCRSPMAEAILKHKSTNFNVKSAGTFAGQGADANPNTVQVLQENNIQITHRSQQVTEDLLGWAHVVLTMTRSHKEQLLHQFPSKEDKIYTIMEYVNEGKKSESRIDIIDPFGGSIDTYRQTYVELEQLIKKLIKTNK